MRWWRDGGMTNLGNLVLVCWNCHSHIHHQGWQVTRDASGRYRAGPPDEAPRELFIDKSIEHERLRHTG
jgi:hypothetical protein